ncbi:protein phosphatase [Lithospermum erythrorhizon]|uniref:Protein phosphatase n=1 Tax=Lithospermum erythrorhizon TaxID=34254 RepID=A0AAV3Q4U4_LITER
MPLQMPLPKRDKQGRIVRSLTLLFCSGTTAVTLVKQGKDLVIGNLTADLKPNLPAEMERIHKSKGRVFSLRDERMWEGCDISYRHLTEKDEFIVLATDGIWDVLSNEEVVKIVASAPARASASRKLVESAVRGWKMKYPTSKVDDCAVRKKFSNVEEGSGEGKGRRKIGSLARSWESSALLKGYLV